MIITSVTPVLPMRIKDIDDCWCLVLAINNYFDETLGNECEPIVVYSTEYGSKHSDEAWATSVYFNGEWVNTDEF
jgi:hypothetical protein